jgi:hypothetical protein
MPGPPPKPRALKLVSPTGYDVQGKRRVNQNEPRPAAGCSPPAWLQGPALELWKVEAPKLHRLGLLTELDGSALATMCVLELQFEVEAAAKEPKLSKLLFLSKELRGLWARFGKTPADRSRVNVETPKPESKLQRLAGGAKRA